MSTLKQPSLPGEVNLRELLWAFTRLVSVDPVLGPLMQRKLGPFPRGAWEYHVHQLEGFWQATECCPRPPLRCGLGLPARHFTLWCRLWYAALEQHLTPAQSSLWSRCTARHRLKFKQFVTAPNLLSEVIPMSHEPRPKAPEVLVKAPGGRALLFHYGAGEGLPPHTHAGQAVVVAVLRGRLRLNVADQVHEVSAGEVKHVETDSFFSSLALQDDTKVLVTLFNLGES